MRTSYYDDYYYDGDYYYYSPFYYPGDKNEIGNAKRRETGKRSARGSVTEVDPANERVGETATGVTATGNMTGTGSMKRRSSREESWRGSFERRKKPISRSVKKSLINGGSGLKLHGGHGLSCPMSWPWWCFMYMVNPTKHCLRAFFLLYQSFIIHLKFTQSLPLWFYFLVF